MILENRIHYWDIIKLWVAFIDTNLIITGSKTFWDCWTTQSEERMRILTGHYEISGNVNDHPDTDKTELNISAWKKSKKSVAVKKSMILFCKFLNMKSFLAYFHKRSGGHVQGHILMLSRGLWLPLIKIEAWCRPSQSIPGLVRGEQPGLNTFTMTWPLESDHRSLIWAQRNVLTVIGKGRN